MSFNIKTVTMDPEDTSLEGKIKDVIENIFTGKKAPLQRGDLKPESLLIFSTIAEEIKEELKKKKLGNYRGFYNVLVSPYVCITLSEGFGLSYVYTEKYEFQVKYNNGFNCIVRIWK